MHIAYANRRRTGLFRCSLLVAPLLLLAGCGQKGPLTLPNPHQEHAKPAASSTQTPAPSNETSPAGGQP